MKQKAFMSGVCFFVMMCIPIQALASSDATVTLNADDTIEYTNHAGKAEPGYYLGSAFEGMAPGDTATQEIVLVNKNANAVSFYTSETAIQTLEHMNRASGGAYTVTLSVGADKENAQSLLTAVAGGYDSGSTAKDSGLAEIKGLEEYTYVAAVQPEESTKMYLTISLNGEGIDNTRASDYSSSVAELGFHFRAYYGDKAAPTVISKTVIKKEKPTKVEQKGGAKTITEYINETVSLGASVKTGDAAPILAAAAAVFVGGIIIVIAVKKRKKQREGGQ